MSSEPLPPSSDGTRFDDVLANAEVLSDSAPSDLNKPNDVLAQVLGFKFAHYDVSDLISLLLNKLTASSASGYD